MPKVKTTKEKVEKKESKKTGDYHITITVNGNTVEADTNDILSALTEYPVTDFIKTDLLIKAEKGGKTSEKWFGVFKARQTLNNATALSILASNLTKELG